MVYDAVLPSRDRDRLLNSIFITKATHASNFFLFFFKSQVISHPNIMSTKKKTPRECLQCLLSGK